MNEQRNRISCPLARSRERASGASSSALFEDTPLSLSPRPSPASGRGEQSRHARTMPPLRKQELASLVAS